MDSAYTAWVEQLRGSFPELVAVLVATAPEEEDARVEDGTEDGEDARAEVEKEAADGETVKGGVDKVEVVEDEVRAGTTPSVE